MRRTAPRRRVGVRAPSAGPGLCVGRAGACPHSALLKRSGRREAQKLSGLPSSRCTEELKLCGLPSSGRTEAQKVSGLPSSGRTEEQRIFPHVEMAPQMGGEGRTRDSRKPGPDGARWLPQEREAARRTGWAGGRGGAHGPPGPGTLHADDSKGRSDGWSGDRCRVRWLSRRSSSRTARSPIARGPRGLGGPNAPIRLGKSPACRQREAPRAALGRMAGCARSLSPPLQPWPSLTQRSF